MQKDLKKVVQSKWTEGGTTDPNRTLKNKKEDVQTNVHLSRPATPGAQKEMNQEVVTTKSIVQELLAQGLTPDQIVMPGGAKDIILFIADDFDAPLEIFDQYGITRI